MYPTAISSQLSGMKLKFAPSSCQLALWLLLIVLY